MRIIKSTEHSYRGFRLLGRYTTTSGGWVLGGRHYREGGITRNYWIVKDGIRYFPGSLISTLKDAKELVDDIINRENNPSSADSENRNVENPG
jgi:hypothetical protein